MGPTKKDLLRLNMNPGIGRSTLFKLYHHFGCFTAAINASRQSWQNAGVNPELLTAVAKPQSTDFCNLLKKMDKLNIHLLSYWDDGYPPLLRTIYDPPALLYVRGVMPEQDSLAIVGSRKATPAGLDFARKLARQLAEQRVCIVSGMARGVDSAAHQGALDGNGATVAVLGCGVDHIYPPENARLYQQIIDQGAVISEHPPGTRPAAGHFPGRNRIISGLARGVLIVEAAIGSGSLITADFALDQGRELFASPGAISHPNSHGPHQLLKEGAQIVTDANDILQTLWPQRGCYSNPRCTAEPPVDLEPKALSVYRMLGENPLHHDEIARKCALTPMDLSAILLDLELRGGAKQLPGGHYTRGSLA
ncbi:MAG: DNA-processing protein DprA [Pelovirga sp.]